MVSQQIDRLTLDISKACIHSHKKDNRYSHIALVVQRKLNPIVETDLRVERLGDGEEEKNVTREKR